ncbi:small integral membrane protein 22 isoform X1 [Callorhinchus milii]|nr:small integral membrane protein 22 isoform X1 [Callorhinchus milii]XP_007903063.1 small integral membrane protein 22 isoform X1 [Callorhinchus milii]XP_007903064.1 small integral membrane protein 22 isoform X1 [Callorhinchus milii]XP_042196863.1 small integral membrane protein 22 isoform X1 [Callorhinchus milii]|eukprot:gi/632973250/ref/XP_007903062.1/ PREDICTED: small integral membrane protein 22 isoform X2 [Callorhinchus milii]
MQNRDLGNEIEDQFNDVLSRFQSKELFQSNWDIATFAIFLTFIATVILLILLVLVRCCCCCCCSSSKSRKTKVGVDNLGMEP